MEKNDVDYAEHVFTLYQYLKERCQKGLKFSLWWLKLLQFCLLADPDLTEIRTTIESSRQIINLPCGMFDALS